MIRRHHEWQTATNDDITFVKTSPLCRPGKKHPPGIYTYWYRDLVSGGNVAVLRHNKETGITEIDINNAPINRNQ